MSTQHQTTKLTEPSHLPPAPLPPPPSSLCHSTLPNGFKYYIQPNSHPKNRIVAHLVVGVGSLAEKEHERGVAHFLEHLAFRGTNTFDHGELIKFFERSGMSFGHHVNAHTGQTETVYKLEAPAKDRQLLLKAIDVLAEWGTGGIRISDEDVQAERNIIEEEWRGREGVAQRMLESYWSRIFKNGGAQLYAERFPIGLLSVIRNVSSKVLQNFYNTWYRADTMAVIVSGDFQENSDIHVIENHIIEKFGKMPPPTIDSPKPPIAPNPKHPQALAVALTDSELTATAVNLEFFKPIVPNNTMSMVKEVICQKLFTSLLDRRLRRLSKSTAPGRHVSATQEASLCGCESNANVEHQRQNTSSKALLPILLTGSVGVNPVVPTLERTTMSIWTRKGDEQKGLQCLLVELVSLCRHGFTNQEFTIAREKWRNTITHQSKDPTSCTSSSIAKELKYHYLQGLAFLGNDQENQLSLDALEKLTGNDLLLWILSRYDIEQLYTKKDALTTLSDQFFAVSSQIQKDGEHVPDGFESHQTLAKTFDRTMRLAIEQVDAIQNSIVDFNNTDVNGETKSSVEVDNDDPEWSIQVPKHDHHVVKEAHMKSIDAVEWKLSNGLTVCVKKLEREGKEGIQFQGFALRGRSELNEVEDTNFCFLPDLVAESGLGNLNGLEMSDMRSRKNCRVNVQKHFYHRGIGGSCKSNADVELLLQQIYMIMTKVQLDENALNVLVERTRETVKNQDNSSEVTFMRTVQQLLFGDVPLLRSLTNELLDSVNHQKMQELFNLAFVEKPSNYVLCFTGSIPDINHFKFLIEKYIGAISDKKIQNRREKKEKNMNDDDISTAARWSHGPSASPSPICVSLPTNKVERHVQERVADKATSMICLPVPKLPRDTVAIDHSLKIACNILRNRLLSEVRQKQSDIYNVSVSWNHSHMSRHGAILISWSNKPSNTKRIKDAVMYEIQQLKTNGPLQESLDSVLKIEKRRIEGTVGNASYWLFHILDGYKTHRFVSGETNLSSQSEKTNNDNCENYIRSRCPIGAYERLETFTVQGIQEIFQQYFNVEKMLNCVLGPKIKIENENEKESKM